MDWKDGTAEERENFQASIASILAEALEIYKTDLRGKIEDLPQTIMNYPPDDAVYRGTVLALLDDPKNIPNWPFDTPDRRNGERRGHIGKREYDKTSVASSRGCDCHPLDRRKNDRRTPSITESTV